MGSLDKGNMLDPMQMERYILMAEKFVHQFRSPLTGVNGYIELLKEKETSVAGLKYLNKVEEGLNESFSMLKRTEFFAQPVSVQPTWFSLDLFIQTIRQSFDKTNNENILFSAPDNQMEIFSDFHALTQIVTELLNNALESDSADDHSVYFNIFAEGTIQIKNEVTGLTDQDLSHLFLPFYTTKSLHMGLGLPICQHFCQELSAPLQASLDHDRQVICFQLNEIKMAPSRANN
ncbi:MAG: HAMP domain-containing sensor histidine kinase [Balneolales bacterium]